MKLILIILSFLSNQVIKKHKPKIIWITWSVGKTSATSFLFQTLKNKYGNNVYMSPYNYNWEFWLPLTILMQKSANKNIFGWFLIFIKWIKLLFISNYPKILILEYGIDHPGEMEYLTKIAYPDIAVLLNISTNHIEQFKNIETIANEKRKIIWPKSKVVFNFDDNLLQDLEWKWYSLLSSNSTIFATNIVEEIAKINFDLCYESKVYSLSYNVIWAYQTYNILMMFLVLLELWINIEEIIDLSRNITGSIWRSSILRWIDDSIIIDWSYNWGLLPITSWLEYLNNIKENVYKIALIWDTRELWDYSKEVHVNLAEYLKTLNLDNIFLVWEETTKYTYPLLKEQYWDKVQSFLDSREAWKLIKQVIEVVEKQSIIFVKWSQNTIYLEEAIKQFCLHDEATKLVRQGKKRFKTKNRFFNSIAHE